MERVQRDDHIAARTELAHELDRRLVRLGPGVAEERLCTAKAFGQLGRERPHRLGTEQVRGMPEPVELCMRGRQRGRMPVAERHDRDPGGEVEILAAVGIGKARAEPVDEGNPARRIRRQQRVLESDAHAVTAVTPISAATPLRTAAAAASSFGTMPPSNVPSSTSAWACRAAIVCTSRPSW